MKVRNGFVSNSSSSSFVVNKSDLTPEEIEILLDYSQIPDQAFEDDNDNDFYPDTWRIEETLDTISGNTSCDNWYLKRYLDKTMPGFYYKLQEKAKEKGDCYWDGNFHAKKNKEI